MQSCILSLLPIRMATHPVTALALLLLASLSSGEIDTYAKCGTDRSVLLRALFETEDNLYQMDNVFSPARDDSSRHIEVNYFFINTSTGIEDELCSVRYIWALGGIFLIQPPRIYEFTSLLFSTPVNELESFNITLPSECKVLLHPNEDGTCTCNNAPALDRLTEQVMQLEGNYFFLVRSSECHSELSP